jgi:hypothetical protein
VRATEHEDTRAKLESYTEGTLGDVDWVLVRSHLAECADCRVELDRATTWNRALPQGIPPGAPDRRGRWRSEPPGWPIVLGTALVTALVASGVGYAVGVSAGF